MKLAFPSHFESNLKTRWNSTFDMLKMVLEYHLVIDDITANRVLKLRKYELDDNNWKIISDLIQVLKVCLIFVFLKCVVLIVT